MRERSRGDAAPAAAPLSLPAFTTIVDERQVALLRYDGVNWTLMTVPLAAVTNNDTLLQIVATGAR